MKMFIVYSVENDGYYSSNTLLFVTHSEDTLKRWIERYENIGRKMREIYLDNNNPRRDGISKLYDSRFLGDVFYEEIEVK